VRKFARCGTGGSLALPRWLFTLAGQYFFSGPANLAIRPGIIIIIGWKRERATEE
jgi:hypothetical protein